MPDARGIQGHFPAGQGHFSFVPRVQTFPVAHPAPHLLTISGSFSLVFWPGHESDDSPPSNAEVKNGYVLPRRRDSIVSIITRIWTERAWVRIPAGKILYTLQNVQTVSGSQAVAYYMGTRVRSRG